MPLVPSNPILVENLAQAFATTVKSVSFIYTLFVSISLHRSILNTSIHRQTLVLCFSPPYSKKKFQCDICKKFGSSHWPYRCGSYKYDVHMNCAMSNRLPPATEIQRTKQQIVCPIDSANTQFQSYPSSTCHWDPNKKQKLHHSNSANIQIQPITAIQVQQTHHTARAKTYVQPVTGIQQTQQQPQLPKSRSFPPQFSKFMTDLPNLRSTFPHDSQPVMPIP
ncbi:hypothetical protein REPUB_Repub06bG0133800 [Reevesia pubescens]